MRRNQGSRKCVPGVPAVSDKSSLVGQIEIQGYMKILYFVHLSIDLAILSNQLDNLSNLSNELAILSNQFDTLSNKLTIFPISSMSLPFCPILSNLSI